MGRADAGLEAVARGAQVEAGATDDDGPPAAVDDLIDLGMGTLGVLGDREALADIDDADHPVLEPRALPRPHTLSFAGMAACGLLIERARAQRSVQHLLWAVPLLAAWSNLHVESLFGLAYLGCFAVGMVLESDGAARALGWRALLVTAACAAATLVSLPVLIAGFAAQDKLVRGLSLGAIK